MKGKKKRKASLSITIFTILIPLLFLIPTAWANSQISISFDPRPNEPPACPINIYPQDGATDIEVPVTLQVVVYDESSSTVDVYFYNGLDNASIGVDYNVSADWSTATVIWSGLQYETNYSWYAVVNDSEYENTSQTWTFITESSSSSPSPTYTYYGEDSEDDDSPTTSDIHYVVTGSTIEVVIETISTGETREIILEKSNGIGIDNIYFTPTVDFTNVKITIEKLADKPENINTALTETKSVYTYVDIELTADNESIGEDEIESLIILFKVDLTWITENNIDKETIASMRYCVRHGNEWHNLTTTILSEDETYVYCTMETNRTSIFAIVADEIVEPLGPPPGTEEKRTQLLLFIALIASITTIALATASIYKHRQIYYMRNKLNNVHDTELKVDELLSRLDNKNNKEIKKRKTGTKPKKKKVTKKQRRNP